MRGGRGAYTNEFKWHVQINGMRIIPAGMRSFLTVKIDAQGFPSEDRGGS